MGATWYKFKETLEDGEIYPHRRYRKSKAFSLKQSKQIASMKTPMTAVDGLLNSRTTPSNGASATLPLQTQFQPPPFLDTDSFYIYIRKIIIRAMAMVDATGEFMPLLAEFGGSNPGTWHIFCVVFRHGKREREHE